VGGQRLFTFDRRIGKPLVCGADEAGRGCLAGPLVAAAVLFDYSRVTTRELRALANLNDSKAHTPQTREALYPLIVRSAARVTVVSRCVRGIDGRGLHRTNLLALRDAMLGAGAGHADVAYVVDGFKVPEFEYEQRAIIDGDATSAAIAAASIIAKVSRDRYMAIAEREHPGWGFGEHMGYSTTVHREAIIRTGVSPLHRMSFQSSAYVGLDRRTAASS
jgi:ribonuclease HII